MPPDRAAIAAEFKALVRAAVLGPAAEVAIWLALRDEAGRDLPPLRVTVSGQLRVWSPVGQPVPPAAAWAEFRDFYRQATLDAIDRLIRDAPGDTPARLMRGPDCPVTVYGFGLEIIPDTGEPDEQERPTDGD